MQEIEGLRDFQKILEQLVDRKNHKDGLEDKLKDRSDIHAVIQALIAICRYMHVPVYQG